MDGSPAGPLLFNASLFSELKHVPRHRREALALQVEFGLQRNYEATVL